MPDDETEIQGGDPPCWLHRVCPACGRLNTERDAEVCEACGADLAE